MAMVERREHEALGLATDPEVDCAFAAVAADHQAEAERRRRLAATYERVFPASDYA